MHAPSSPVLRLPSGAQLVHGVRSWWPRTPGAVAMAALLAFAAPLKFFVGFLSVMRTPEPADVVQVGLWWVLYGFILWLALLVAGQAGMHAMRDEGRRVRVLSWILLAFACSAVANLATVRRAGILMELGVVEGALPMLLYGNVLSFTLALLYFAHVATTQGHERAVARLACAQAAQREARRRFVQRDLQAVQARMDPALLFDMLEAVRQAYTTDAARAERLLDELIAFLRASLPRVRVAASSLAREIELARSYLRLLSLARGEERALHVETLRGAMHARFPPGALLPVLEGALRSHSGDCMLRADCDAGRCTLQLVLPTPVSDAAIARVRSLLQESDGPAAGLSLANAGRLVTLWVPHEPA